MPTIPTYLHVRPNGKLPVWRSDVPFRCVVVIQADVAWDWRKVVSEWLVDGGCLYMMAWGPECSRWDDAVDDANLERYEYGDIPEEKFVMTTWHDDAPLSEVFWFAKELANHPTVALDSTVLLHISTTAAEPEMLAAFENTED